MFLFYFTELNCNCDTDFAIYHDTIRCLAVLRIIHIFNICYFLDTCKIGEKVIKF